MQNLQKFPYREASKELEVLHKKKKNHTFEQGMTKR